MKEQTLNFQKLFFFFLIGSLFGTLYETLLWFGQYGIWQFHREVLYLPLIPTYGVMVVFLTVFGNKKRTWWQIFLFSTLLGGISEYIFSFCYDVVLGVKFWDYSDLFLNIHGRTTLLFALFWGGLGTFYIYKLRPYFFSAWEKIPSFLQKFFFLLLCPIVCLDLILTYTTIGRMHLRNEGVSAFTFLGKIYDQVFTDQYLYEHLSFMQKDSQIEEWEKKPIWQGDALIGHAFYEVDGFAYTSSKEAFLNGYAKGIRTFEVDFQFTSDEELVLVHDWSLFPNFEHIPTLKEFKETKIKDRYTSLSYDDLLEIMKEYPDIWIVTDSKYTDLATVKKEFQFMKDEALKMNDLSLLNRFIVQIYQEDMYDVIEDIYPFQNIIFTVYQVFHDHMITNSPFQEEDYQRFQEICEWCRAHHIQNVTFPKEFYQERIQNIIFENDLQLYLHTENDFKMAQEYFSHGVKGIYTDCLWFS